MKKTTQSQLRSSRQPSDWSWLYLCGQLSNLERKTIEPMVLSLLGAIPNAIRDAQRFMSQSPLVIWARSRTARKAYS